MDAYSRSATLRKTLTTKALTAGRSQ